MAAQRPLGYRILPPSGSLPRARRHPLRIHQNRQRALAHGER
ncbi:hypothetical protein CIHG_07913 [Coccidioides immitis H538.4]|uniref:Uncharacterized protein n=1 Tax=Coccidioides immitis H538.4 TaxID=396776 RepID=A0A0J8UR78_COCIT|nr:hypothetical protein CIHG_07913 [Coccidioides immitis H538.4]